MTLSLAINDFSSLSIIAVAFVGRNITCPDWSRIYYKIYLIQNDNVLIGLTFSSCFETKFLAHVGFGVNHLLQLVQRSADNSHQC